MKGLDPLLSLAPLCLKPYGLRLGGAALLLECGKRQPYRLKLPLEAGTVFSGISSILYCSRSLGLGCFHSLVSQQRLLVPLSLGGFGPPSFPG